MTSAPQPQLAPVKPRVLSPDGGGPRLLEDVVAALLQQEGGKVWLLAPRGGGKSTAIAHLRAVFRSRPDLLALDEHEPLAGRTARVLVVATTHAPEQDGATLQLAPWTDEDCRAYLLARWPQTAEVAYAAWRQPAPLFDLRSRPRLCAAALDHLALVAAASLHGDDAGDALCALAFVLAAEFGERRASARRLALRSFGAALPRGYRDVADGELDAEELEVLDALVVRSLLAAEGLVRLGLGGEASPLPPRAWPEPLIRAIEHLLHADPALLHGLTDMVTRPRRNAALPMSLLCISAPGFRPPLGRYADLSGARLRGADFCGAELAGCRLDHADLQGARFVDADLRRASLRGTLLRGADLSRANLLGADLQGCDLEGAVLDGALLDADWRARLLAARASGQSAG